MSQSTTIDLRIVFVNGPNHNQNEERLLKNTFDDVSIVNNSEDAIVAIMSRKDSNAPILLLIDIDLHYRLLERVCRAIQFDTLSKIVPIACSKNDSSSLMVQCIQTGASDFILRPFREAVLKTKFLNLYRHNKSQKNISMTGPKNSAWLQLQGRLENIFSKNDYCETILSQYTPQPTIHRSSMSDFSSERTRFLNNFVNDWNFSPLGLNEKDLVQCAFIMLDQTFNQLPTLEPLRMSNDTLYDLLFDVCNSYHNSNPYHNFRHALDVMQSTWYFLCSIHALRFSNISETSPTETSVSKDEHNILTHSEFVRRLLRPIDILALLMAGIGHDLGHPGVNNGFMVTTATPLAVLYNDKSVLESYHCMAFFYLLRKHNFKAVVDPKSRQEYKDFRKIAVQSILCTDMGCHGEYVASIKNQTDRLSKTKAEDLLTNKETQDKERLVLCSAIMKCADISNCARPFENAKNWAVQLAQEFFIQGDLEKELGIPSVPINERGKVSLPDFQLSFMKNVALDLYESVGKLFPEMQYCADSINANIAIWESKKKEER